RAAREVFDEETTFDLRPRSWLDRWRRAGLLLPAAALAVGLGLAGLGYAAWTLARQEAAPVTTTARPAEPMPAASTAP
ncbi:MAG: type II secretory pathway protein ExeA, partial [Caldimonas sp.]